jgi:TetR/AcrR family transcriptional repressor of uid operon
VAQSSPNAPPHRERQRADTHKRVYEAALAEFRRVGFANAQIDRIAKKAGVVRGTFYFHFPSKEHVLLELEQTLESEIAERLARLSRESPSIRDVLTDVIGGVLAVVAAVGDERLMRDLLSVYVRQPSETAVAEQPFPLVEELEHVLAAAADRGELRAELRSDQLTTMFLTCVLGSLLARADSPEERRVALESLVDVFLRGVGA